LRWLATSLCSIPRSTTFAVAKRWLCTWDMSLCLETRSILSWKEQTSHGREPVIFNRMLMVKAHI
jgi:hypothetical protein